MAVRASCLRHSNAWTQRSGVLPCAHHRLLPVRPWAGRVAHPNVKPRAASEPGASTSSPADPVYVGRFGPWKLTDADKAEVYGYRAGLTVVALTTLTSAALAFLPADQTELRSAITSALNPLALTGAAALGVSLQLIHIYMAPLKRALQVLWLVGTLGGVYLMATQDTPVALFTVEHPWAVWLIGPLFAALTGVAFKEGLCYGRLESAGLFGAIPLLLLGHLTGLVPEEGRRGMLAAMVILLAVFAARKYTQPIKDDVGDKSVFMYLAASDEEKARMQQAAASQGLDL